MEDAGSDDHTNGKCENGSYEAQERTRERERDRKKNTRRNTFFFLLMHLLCDNHYTVHLNFDMLLTFETHVRTFTQCHSFLTDLILG